MIAGGFGDEPVCFLPRKASTVAMKRASMGTTRYRIGRRLPARGRESRRRRIAVRLAGSSTVTLTGLSSAIGPSFSFAMSAPIGFEDESRVTMTRDGGSPAGW